MNAIEEIFHMKYDGPNVLRPRTKTYEEAEHQALALAITLNESMTPEQRAIWDRYSDCRIAASEMLYLEYFRYGISLGVCLAMESVQYDESESIGAQK